MSVDLNADVEQLAVYVERVDALLLSAETQLRSFAKPEAPEDEYDLDLPSILEQFEGVLATVQQFHEVFTRWNEKELNMLQKSEVSRTQGQIKRLFIVSKNIVRLSRQQLGVPDPERDQEELQMQMTRMNVLFR